MKSIAVIASCWLVLCSAGIASAADAPAPDPQKIDQAIRKAIDYFYSQEKNGAWKDEKVTLDHQQQTGTSAIATYALLAAHESPTEPHMAAAIGAMQRTPSSATYVAAMRCQVWNLLPRNKELQQYIRADFTSLAAGTDQCRVKGLWSYGIDTTTSAKGNWDLSNSQYGLLGMWACGQCGLEVPDAYWSAAEKAWIKEQGADGGWCYQGKSMGSPEVSWYGATENTAFAAAGVASLMILQDELHAGEGLLCKGNLHSDAIDNGMAYLAKHAPTDLGLYPTYTLYGFSRIGVAGGYKCFGDYNWFNAGADYLLKNQQADGSFAGQLGTVPETSFAILFLVRGRGQVVFNKIQYAIDPHGDKPIDTNWNQRPRDAANATRWIGKQLERDLNWQVLNLNTATMDDLHDAPILYLSGNQDPQLTAEQEAKLKQFVDEGGMIFGNADCGDKKFADGFRALGERLFKNYKFRLLGKNHNLFNRPVPIKTPPALMGLSNGVRELMVLNADADVAKSWQSAATLSKAVNFQLAENLFLSVGDWSSATYKGQTYIVKRDAAAATQTVKVARLMAGSNSDPEPGAWVRLGNVLHNKQHLDVAAEPIELGSGKLDVSYKLAVLTGTDQLALTDAQEQEIKKYLDGGGTLVVDATGGDPAFAASATAELAKILPGGKLTALPSSHPILAGVEIAWRPYAKKALGAMHGSRLKGIDLNGRTAVFYSGEDITAGLVGETLDGIVGYMPDVATSLMGNIVAYSIKPPDMTPQAPATGPASAPGNNSR